LSLRHRLGVSAGEHLLVRSLFLASLGFLKNVKSGALRLFHLLFLRIICACHSQVFAVLSLWHDVRGVHVASRWLRAEHLTIFRLAPQEGPDVLEQATTALLLGLRWGGQRIVIIITKHHVLDSSTTSAKVHDFIGLVIGFVSICPILVLVASLFAFGFLRKNVETIIELAVLIVSRFTPRLYELHLLFAQLLLELALELHLSFRLLPEEVQLVASRLLRLR